MDTTGGAGAVVDGVALRGGFGGAETKPIGGNGTCFENQRERIESPKYLSFAPGTYSEMVRVNVTALAEHVVRFRSYSL